MLRTPLCATCEHTFLMNIRTLRPARALLLLVSLSLATPALADTGVPSTHSNVGTKLGACVAHVVQLSGTGNVKLNDLEKGIIAQCQPETVAWNAWCRPLFEKQHPLNYAVAQCNKQWVLTVVTIISALKQGGALHFQDGK